MSEKNEAEQTLDLGDTTEANQLKEQKKKDSDKKIKKETSIANISSKCASNKLLFAIVLILCVLTGYNTYQIEHLKQSVSEKTYVYNMEAVLMQTGMADENRKFEENMNNLSKEIDASEKKVKSMKDKKLQNEYREMYMKSLTLKRDNLVEEHEKFMKSLLKNINKALSEVATENNIKVIYSNKAVVFSTKYVTDVTPVVAEKLKEKME